MIYDILYMAALRRINKDLLDIKSGDYLNIDAGPTELKKHNAEGKIETTQNMFKWMATIIGPTGTPYDGGVFSLEIAFPNNYPFKPPAVKFLTKIYHPNINVDGQICLDVLRETWSPGMNVGKLLASICSLFGDPNADDPLNAEAGKLYQQDKLKFDQKAREWTETYA